MSYPYQAQVIAVASRLIEKHGSTTAKMVSEELMEDGLKNIPSNKTIGHILSLRYERSLIKNPSTYSYRGRLKK